jgi:hypothetical protein
MGAGGAFLPTDDQSITGNWTFSSSPTITSSGTLVATTATQTLTNKTLTSPTVTSETSANPTITGDASSGVVVSKTVAFVENATMTTSTGTVVIPAGATLVDIVVTSSVLWSKASSRFTCGDAQAATGWFTSTDLSGTDLLVGEALRAAGGSASWGGVNGAYLVSATGVFGQATATKAGPYYVSAGSVIGVVTVTPGAGTAGRTFMTVTYSVGQVTAPVVA